MNHAKNDDAGYQDFFFAGRRVNETVGRGVRRTSRGSSEQGTESRPSSAHQNDAEHRKEQQRPAGRGNRLAGGGAGRGEPGDRFGTRERSCLSFCFFALASGVRSRRIINGLVTLLFLPSSLFPRPRPVPQGASTNQPNQTIREDVKKENVLKPPK